MPNEPMTEERLAEIMGREKAATQGPWVFEEPDGKVLLGYTPKEVRVCESGCLGSIGSRFVCDMHSDWRYTYKNKDEPLANAAFLAHAREDIPALLAEVERLRAELENADKRTKFWIYFSALLSGGKSGIGGKLNTSMSFSDLPEMSKEELFK